MTQEDIIRMAREADVSIRGNWDEMALERFAALVEEAATEAANVRANNSWTLMCKKMVAAEREACAKVCDVLAVHPEYASEVTKLAAAAIRARTKA